VTSDRELIDQMATITLSAAVRICHCPEPTLLGEGEGSGPVLWGADSAGALTGDVLHPCDVLLGTSAQAEQLWLVASARPRARVAVLPQAAGWLGEYLGQWALRAGHGRTLVVSGLVGGIGTSSLACLVAHAGTLSGLGAAVLDLDPHSGSLWPALDWQQATGIGWEQLRDSGGHLAPHQFREALPRVANTAVLTWQQDAGSFPIDEQLLVRVLTAARQAFDLVLVDAGRHPHPLSPVLGQFLDRQLVTCTDSQLEHARNLRAAYLLCGVARTPHSRQAQPADEGFVGYFPQLAGIARCAQRGELLQALRSRRLRQRVADYRLLPEQPGTRP